MKKKYRTNLSKEECISKFKSQDPYKKVKYNTMWTFGEDMRSNPAVFTKRVIDLSVFLWPLKYCFMKVVCVINEKENTEVEIKAKLQKTDIVLPFLIAISVIDLIATGFDFLKLYPVLLITLI